MKLFDNPLFVDYLDDSKEQEMLKQKIDFMRSKYGTILESLGYAFSGHFVEHFSGHQDSIVNEAGMFWSGNGIVFSVSHGINQRDTSIDAHYNLFMFPNKQPRQRNKPRLLVINNVHVEPRNPFYGLDVGGSIREFHNEISDKGVMSPYILSTANRDLAGEIIYEHNYLDRCYIEFFDETGTKVEHVYENGEEIPNARNSLHLVRDFISPDCHLTREGDIIPHAIAI